MDARTQRTLIRVGTLAGALIVGTAIIVLFPNLDPRLSGPVLGLTITAALGLDQWLKNSGDNAAPTVRSVSTALNDQAALAGTIPAPLVPPTQPSPAPMPPKPFDTLPPAP